MTVTQTCVGVVSSKDWIDALEAEIARLIESEPRLAEAEPLIRSATEAGPVLASERLQASACRLIAPPKVATIAAARQT